MLLRNHRLIHSVLIWLIPIIFLSSCSWFREPVKEIKIVKEPIERIPLNIPDADPLRLIPTKWIVVTPDNIESVWKKLEAAGYDLVLFGVTDDGYKQLSMDFLKIRQHIKYQKFIIGKYREYYEPKKEETK